MVLRHWLEGGLEAWGREGWLGLRHGREGWPGLSNGKKRYSVGLDKNLKKNLPKNASGIFWNIFLRFLSSSINYLSFSHCLALAIPPSHASSPAIPLFPMPQAHASSPAHPQAHASSPCQAHASSPYLKPIPLFHVSSPGTPSFLDLQPLSFVLEGFFRHL